MARTPALLVLTFLVAASGCLQDEPLANDLQALDADAPGPAPDAGPDAPPDAVAPPVEARTYAGTTTVREVSVCPPTGCPVVGGQFGYWAWDVDGEIRTQGATDATVEVTWEPAHPGVQALDVFVYEGNLGAYRVLARADGTSPLTIHVDGDVLAEHETVLKVGFTGDAPASVLLDQEVSWEATVTP